MSSFYLKFKTWPKLIHIYKHIYITTLKYFGVSHLISCTHKESYKKLIVVNIMSRNLRRWVYRQHWWPSTNHHHLSCLWAVLYDSPKDWPFDSQMLSSYLFFFILAMYQAEKVLLGLMILSHVHPSSFSFFLFPQCELGCHGIQRLQLIISWLFSFAMRCSRSYGCI